MRFPIFITTLCVSLSIYGTALCATMIESKEAEAGLQKTWIEGNRLRVETGEENQYMLMDFDKRTMYLVNEYRRTALDMSKIASEHTTDQPASNLIDYKVVKKGDGPVIAGYATEHYAVMKDDITCLETYNSTKATSSLNLMGFITGMNEMFPEMGTLGLDDDPCKFAETALQYEKIGIPLRIIKNGIENYTVTRLEKNATVPEGGFSVPEGFRMIDYSQMVLDMAKDEQK